MAVHCVMQYCVIGFIGGAAFLVGTGYVHCNAALAVALIVIAVGVSGISWGGWSVNHLDLAPPYAGALSTKHFHTLTSEVLA